MHSNKKDSSSLTQGEIQNSIREEIRKTIHQYDINPSTIYSGLGEKWERYNLDFLKNEVTQALQSAYRSKGIMTYFDNGTDYMRNNIKSCAKYCTEMPPNQFDNFPIYNCFIGGDYNNNHYIVCFAEQCIAEKDLYGFDILFAVQFSLTPIAECQDFLNYQLKKNFVNNIEAFAEYMDNICLEYKKFLDEKHTPFFKKYISKLLPDSDKKSDGAKTEGTKLNWLGTPSQFGYIFLQLAKKGYIELPSTAGDASYYRYAKVCYTLFSFKNNTTLENLKKEMNPNSNTLSNGVRAKFSFPNLDEIKHK